MNPIANFLIWVGVATPALVGFGYLAVQAIAGQP